MPERTRLFRLLATYADWTAYCLAQPTLLGVADTYGIELRHPWREDRADLQIGGKGLSNHRWIVGAKLAYVVNHYGLIVAWDYAAAHVADNAFHELIADFQAQAPSGTCGQGQPPDRRVRAGARHDAHAGGACQRPSRALAGPRRAHFLGVTGLALP